MDTIQHPALKEGSETVSIYFYLIFLLMMLFFFVGSAVIEKFKPKYGHETGYTIIFGVALSLIIYAIVGDRVASTF